MPQPDQSKRTRWDPSDAPPIVWLIGPWHDGEFALTLDALGLRQEAPKMPTLDAAIAAVAAAERPPEVALLAQPRPGLWQQADADRWQAAAPLARTIVVAGSWCEGELRTGRPLAGLLRLYWHEFPAWWREALARRSTGLAPHWSRAGEAAKAIDPTPRRDATPRVVGVDAIEFATFEALALALRPLGWECTWTPRGRGDLQSADAGIWDGGQLDPAEVESLRQFGQRFGVSPAPVVALVDFPRAEHVELLAQTGAPAMLGKPYSVAALATELTRMATGVASSVPLSSTETG